MSKVIFVTDVINTVLCSVAAALYLYDGSIGLGIAWTCAVMGWACSSLNALSANRYRCWSKKWEGLVEKCIKCLQVIVGEKRCVGVVVSKDKDGDGSDDMKKDVPASSIEAMEDLKACMVEFFRYIDGGSREFSIEQGSVSIKVSIPEDKMEDDKK